MTEEQITSEELQQLFEQDKNTRLQNCKQGIDMILEKYKCQLVTVPQITPDGRIIAITTIQILSN